MLIGGRANDFHGLTEELLEPLKLHGGAIANLRDVMDGFAQRMRASHGTTRTALLCAADLVILVTAFCEAVGASDIRFETEFGYEESDVITDVVAELERVTLGSRRVSHPS
ncbi:NACHT N-terminal helical domain 7-containing protein [Streptomyces chartreusis]|uniref:NACHT N-terminal helical domain 7-containing protein n=1 Tax=Streptomyces chartreusis TaxID=1969 RepID=UPI003668B7A2